MMSKKDVQRWIDTLDEDALIAIDDGGLTLVEVQTDPLDPGAYSETGDWLEIGGLPLPKFDQEAE